jgi:hypothetical protein
MPLSYSVEIDSFSEYSCGGGQVPNPVDLELYQVCGTMNYILKDGVIKRLMMT